ncbi:hypothetical protein M8J77_010728 [Diaphorina citri]|nr:hypothetical protein M8J77_010728 [Diaphorina citri]
MPPLVARVPSYCEVLIIITVENINDDNNNDTTVQCAISIQHKHLVKSNALDWRQYAQEQPDSRQDQILQNNMTPGQEPTSSNQTWVTHINGEDIAKTTNSNVDLDISDENFLCEVESNNNENGQFPCCDSTRSDSESAPIAVNDTVDLVETKVIDASENSISETVQKAVENFNCASNNNAVNSSGTKEDNDDFELISIETACSSHAKLSNSDHSKYPESSDADNACSLALLNDLHSLVERKQDLSYEDVLLPNTYNLDQYSKLFKKCSNYKKLPNEYVNHNIKRNKLLVNWMSHNCVHIEWNIVDQVSDQDWIGLYRLGKCS